MADRWCGDDTNEMAISECKTTATERQPAQTSDAVPRENTDTSSQQNGSQSLRTIRAQCSLPTGKEYDRHDTETYAAGDHYVFG